MCKPLHGKNRLCIFVSTLLEILDKKCWDVAEVRHYIRVSTLLEILEIIKLLVSSGADVHVSTLLEILGLVWLVVVGF